MKCFCYFKDKNKTRAAQKSATSLKDPIKSDTTEAELGFKSSDSAKTDTERPIKSSGSATSPRSIPEMYEEKAQNLRIFTFSELCKATSNFNRLLKVGEGGFGCVYKGSIKPVGGNGKPMIVAIKKLNTGGNQGHKQWVAEVQFLGVVDHPNLVKLIGYCAMDGDRGIQRLLVYEYMPNKSLEDHLFNRAIPPLSWERRLQIMLGAAQGLAYLHEELEAQVIYRDFKASNVLLDEDFRPKLSDFGLAREGPTADHTHVSTAVVGTYGYAAPDYVQTGHLTSKSDVWSFGVVLYEILTGRRSLERDRPRSQQKLVEWVKHYPADSRKFGMIMDPRLENQFSLGAARKIAKLADSCLLKSAKDRPTMSSVVETLKEILKDSDIEGSPMKHAEGVEDAAGEEEEEKPAKQTGLSESAKRRMDHLAKISENLGGLSRRKFMIAQRANIT